MKNYRMPSSDPETVPAQAEFIEASKELLTDIGFAPDPESIIVEPVFGALQLVAHAPEAQAYCKLRKKDRTSGWQETVRAVSANAREQPFLLNGLLLRQTGRLALPGSSRHVEVDITNSPERYNNTLRLLGRLPGINALEVIEDDGGETPVGRMTQAWSRGKIISSKIADPGMAWHDMSATGHGSSWLGLDALSLGQSMAKAQWLVSRRRLKPKINNPLNHGAPEFTDFCTGAENLVDVTKPLHQGVWAASWNSNCIPVLNGAIGNLVASFYIGDTLRKLGVISARTSKEQQRQMRAACQRTAVNIAQMNLAAETLRPNPDADQHALRKENLGNIVADLAA
jgi:hypothetical protein